MLYVCMYIEKRDVGILNFAAPCSIITAHFSEQHCSMSLAKNSVHILYTTRREIYWKRKICIRGNW